ncbi:MAG: PDZ domain-containing protein, partial [Lachnospiraceae bacterium]|nr:PDZ domain-containing protein [Lachnospiraceae bacterium]
VALTDLEVGTMEAIRIAQMGDSDAIRMGEMVIAIGNALGYGQSVTVGYVSAKDRKVESDKGTSLALIQTDAAINPGNSGGALLNLKGEVIGINSVKYVEESVEGMGFAIPITTASPIIEDLKSREILSEEEKGYIGIVGENITDQIARAYHMPMGIYVYSVTENGPAEQAGLVIGDIIFKVNDKTVSSMDELKEKVNSYRAGETVEVSYYRNIGGNYEENTVSITLTKASDLKVPEN